MHSRLIQSVFFVLLAFHAQAATLKVQFSAAPSQFDPLMMEDGQALRLAANVIATPMEYDSHGMLQKALLESVQVERNSSQFQLKFRSGLKWSDGVAFHANQFLLALKRLSESKVKVALSELFPSVDFTKTQVLNEREVRVVLNKPDTLFLQWCTLPPLAPIREDLIKQYTKDTSPIVPTLAAYRVKEYKRDDKIVLEKNPVFYSSRDVFFDEVQLLLIKDELSLLPLVKAAKLDLLTRVPVLQLNEIKKIANVVEFPVAATTYLGLNTRTAPFHDQNWRKAFRDLVISKNEEMAKALLTGEIPAQTFLPKILLPGEAAQKAKNDSHEIKNTSYVKPIIFQSDSGSRNQTIMELLQSWAKTNLKWNVQLEMVDWKEHLARLKALGVQSTVQSSGPAAYRIGWQNPVGSPAVFYQAIDSNSANNFTGWKSEEYDRLVQKLKTLTENSSNLNERLRLMSRLEEILSDEAPIIPLLHQVLRFSVSKRVSGFRANPFGVILFRELRFVN